MNNEGLFTPSQLIPAHLDGWYNVMTGVGLSNIDKRIHTQFILNDKLDFATLSDIYRAEGLGKKIIDVPVNDMVRRWFYIENDPENDVIKALSKISAKKKIKSALKWSDLFGGAVVFMGINDGQDAKFPVNEANIQEIRFLEVYDRRYISWMPDDLYTDPNEPKYGLPEVYRLINPTTGVEFQVHESRLLRFDGEDLPDQEKIENQGWGDSRLQSIFNRLRGVCDSLGGIEGINIEFIIGVMKIQNLQQLLSSKDGEATLRNRIKALDLVKHSMNTIVIDKNEEFERATSAGVSGLRDLADLLVDVLCGISGIPRVKLIGDQAKGLGGESAGNIRMYYDDISARQEDDLESQLNKLCHYQILALKKNFKNWAIKFNELYQPTEKEEAETRLINAKADGVYMEFGLPPEYFFLSRFGGQSYGKSIILPKEYVNKIKGMSVEQLLEKTEEPEVKPNNSSEEDENEE